MGNRLVKPPPLDRPVAPARGRNNQIQRPFPVLTPQSYIPGGAASGMFPPVGGSPFPALNANSYLPGAASGSFPPMIPPMMPPSMPFPPPSPIGYPSQNVAPMMRPPSPFYDPGPPMYSHRRTRICRPRRSRRCRPVIHIIDSDSCSSVSSCRSVSSCSRRCHRSHSRSRRSVAPQPQQPIIVLPVQCQPSAPAISAPAINSVPPQAQQIVLPPIQVQQPGQLSQTLGLPPIQIPALTGGVQQRPLALPGISLNSSGLLSGTNSSPIILTGGQSLIQPSASLPQLQGAPVQYVQSIPQTSSPLQYVTAERRSTKAPSRVLVNSTNRKHSPAVKPIQRSASVRRVKEMDEKYGRRAFDWYNNKEKNAIITEDVRVGHQ